MRVMKFGGTSVRDHDRIKVAAGLVRDALGESGVAVVVSALGGVTDQLLEIARISQRGEGDYTPLFASLTERHLAVVDALEDPAERETVRSAVGDLLSEIRHLF